MPLQPGSGFVNLSRILGLNQGSADQMGQGLASSYETQAKAAERAATGAPNQADPAFAPAQAAVKSLGQEAERMNDYSGRQIDLQNVYGRPGYTLGQQRYDSFLTGAAPGWDARSSGMYDRYQGIVGGMNQKPQAAPAAAQAPQAPAPKQTSAQTHTTTAAPPPTARPFGGSGFGFGGGGAIPGSGTMFPSLRKYMKGGLIR